MEREARSGARPSPPVPTRLREENEAGPGRQTARMRRVERNILALAQVCGAPLGLNRREFLETSCGLAAAFIALNAVFGPLFAVEAAEAADPDVSAARSLRLADQLVFDVQTHFVSPTFSSPGMLALREAAKHWNPDLRGDATLEDVRFESYFREVFLESDTALAVLSNAPSDEPGGWFLTNEEALAARATIEKRVGSRRLQAHAVFTPGRPGWLEDLERCIALRPDGWKGYTVGSPFAASRWPWRLDDEKLVYPAYERMVKAGITTVAIHKGLLPSGYRTSMADTWEYGNVDDVPRAARDWPQIRFVIYHSAIRSGGIPPAEDRRIFEETGYIPWVSDLARIPEKHGVTNVYAELGSVFAATAVSDPRYCAGILGTLVQGLGEDRVVWGTDSVWYGSPRWQIDAFRRLEIPGDLQGKFGYRPLGPADGPLKGKILAGNAAAVYPFAADALRGDRLQSLREAHGARKP